MFITLYWTFFNETFNNGVQLLPFRLENRGYKKHKNINSYIYIYLFNVM